jgi:hypothetical protein
MEAICSSEMLGITQHNNLEDRGLNRLRVFENKVLRTISGSKMEETMES